MLYVFANCRRRQKDAIQIWPLTVEDEQSDEEVDYVCSKTCMFHDGEDEDDLIQTDANSDDPINPLGHPPAHHPLTPEDIQCIQSLASQLVDL